ncbi:MAG: SIMPL domain-containing protein [Rikenellaceae bacterium]|nr:SIMPL domain-containing protein [Rikenellaceae bacterium]
MEKIATFGRFVAILSTLLLTTTTVRAQEEAFPSYIQVSGRAEREITPDRFTLQIEITERDSKGKISVEEQQRAMVSTLKRLGIDPEKQLKVADNSSELLRRKQAVASALYELKLNSMEQMRTAWSALTELNLKSIRLVKADYSRLEEVRRELRMEAMRNARQTAEELATAIGQQAGRCFYIVDWSNDSAPRLYDNAVMMRTKSTVDEESIEAESEPLEFRSTRLSYQVQTKFVLE